MSQKHHESLLIQDPPKFEDGTLVLALTGWMDGGDVSTGTVARLVDHVSAEEFASIDPEPYYIYNFPGSMEITTLFRPHIEIKDGLICTVEMPTNKFFAHDASQLVFFMGKEPNLNWRAFGECIFEICRQVGIHRILFVGSFGGSVPHTRQPRLYVTCSDESLIAEMEKYGVRRSGYEGPGSFTSYLMTQTTPVGLEMTSLVAEIPGYLQGTNPPSIEAVSRRLATILKLPVDLDELRTASTKWEIEVSNAVEQNEELADKIRKLEEDYDNELLIDGAAD